MASGHPQVSTTLQEGAEALASSGHPTSKCARHKPHGGPSPVGMAEQGRPTDLPTSRTTTAMCRRSCGWCSTGTPLSTRGDLPVHELDISRWVLRVGEWPSPLEHAKGARESLVATGPHPPGKGSGARHAPRAQADRLPGRKQGLVMRTDRCDPPAVGRPRVHLPAHQDQDGSPDRDRDFNLAIPRGEGVRVDS